MTLWPFENVVCFSAPYVRSFVAPRLSAAYCLHLLSLAALVVFPLFAAFASDNVWVKESFYREQPRVAFRHELAVVLGGSSAADAVGWGTRSDLEPLLPAQTRVPVVRASSVDHNGNGVPDALSLSLEMPTDGARSNFQSLLLMVVYDFELREKARTKISALAVVDASSPYPATGVWVRGQLRLRQTMPLHAGSEVRSMYAESPLLVDWRSSWAGEHQPVTVRTLLDRYAARNETVYLEQALPPVWDYSPRDRFEVRVAIDVPPQLVFYVPSSLEMLKFAWMQVLSFSIPTWLLLRAVKAFAFDYQLVETYVIPQRWQGGAS